MLSFRKRILSSLQNTRGKIGAFSLSKQLWVFNTWRTITKETDTDKCVLSHRRLDFYQLWFRLMLRKPLNSNWSPHLRKLVQVSPHPPANVQGRAVQHSVHPALQRRDAEPDHQLGEHWIGGHRDSGAHLQDPHHQRSVGFPRGESSCCPQVPARQRDTYEECVLVHLCEMLRPEMLLILKIQQSSFENLLCCGFCRSVALWISPAGLVTSLSDLCLLTLFHVFVEHLLRSPSLRTPAPLFTASLSISVCVFPLNGSAATLIMQNFPKAAL